MSVSFQSVRFGQVEVADEQVIEFPLGLVGLGGTRYALLDRNPGTGFLWLHCVDDPALALPVVGPRQFFSDFRLEIAEEERERTGIADVEAATIYVTVRATSDPLDVAVNLRAPLLVDGGRGFQVINTVEGASLQAPLFERPPAADTVATRSADAA
jgi:flagellar assembly factor FliW